MIRGTTTPCCKIIFSLIIIIQTIIVTWLSTTLTTTTTTTTTTTVINHYLELSTQLLQQLLSPTQQQEQHQQQSVDIITIITNNTTTHSQTVEKQKQQQQQQHQQQKEETMLRESTITTEPSAATITTPCTILKIPEIIDPTINERVNKIRNVNNNINNNNNNNNNNDNNCSVTSQITINTQTWILQSYDVYGIPKMIGGDEYYITYTSNTTTTTTANNNNNNNNNNTSTGEYHYDAAAIITDQQDGTYQLEFVRPPLWKQQYNNNSSDDDNNNSNSDDGGILTIHFIYTCNIGKMAPPSKQSWYHGGSSSVSYTISISSSPPIRSFIEPLYDPRTGKRINFETYSQVIGFGDSVMMQLLQKKGRWFIQPNHRAYIRENIISELSTNTVSKWIQKLQLWHDKHLSIHNNYTFWSYQNKYNQTVIHPRKKVALLLGSSSWDLIIPDNSIIQGELFLDHLNAIRQLITQIHLLYPYIDLYWKSPNAMHMFRVNCPKPRRKSIQCRDRTKYMSNTRAYYLHTIQKELITNEMIQQHNINITYVDLYEAYYLSADQTYINDGRHYNQYLNAYMLQWYYPDSILQIPDID